MFHGKLEIGGPQIWPDDPDEDYLKLLILSPRFRVGLCVWYIHCPDMWAALSQELGGSFPIEWVLTSRPPGQSFDTLRLTVIRQIYDQLGITTPAELAGLERRPDGGTGDGLSPERYGREESLSGKIFKVYRPGGETITGSSFE